MYDAEDHLWSVVPNGGQAEVRYVYGAGIDSPVARQTVVVGGSGYVAQDSHWYLTDRQGSVLQVIRADTMSSVKAIRYDGGKAVERWGGLPDRFEYTGRPTDHLTGLQDNRARWLRTDLGRFVQEDSFDASVTGDANPYRYVFNSYPNGTDPSGHFFNLISGAIGAVVGGGDQRRERPGRDLPGGGRRCSLRLDLRSGLHGLRPGDHLGGESPGGRRRWRSAQGRRP